MIATADAIVVGAGLAGLAAARALADAVRSGERAGAQVLAALN